MGAEFARRVFSVYRNKKPTLEFLDGFTLTVNKADSVYRIEVSVGDKPFVLLDGKPHVGDFLFDGGHHIVKMVLQNRMQ